MNKIKNLKNWMKRNGYEFEEYSTPDGCGSNLTGIIVGEVEFATENGDLVALFPNGDYEQMSNREAYKLIRNHA